MKNRVIVAALVLGMGSISAAHAGDLYIQGGTQGVGLGYAQPITSFFGVHADINGGSLSHTLTAGDLNYDARLHLLSGGIYADLFPIPSSGFRLTAGVLLNDTYLSGNAQSQNGTYKINGREYYAPGSSVSAKVSYPTAMPYIGIGFGHKPVATAGLGFTADIGVAYGRPHVDFRASPELIAIAGQSNVNAEESQLRDKASNYRFYPILQIGLTYRF